MPHYDSRLGCSTISFRHQPLPEALATISDLGFSEIDLGALPGVCDHVPYVLDMAAVEDVARTVIASGLAGPLDQRRHRRSQCSASTAAPAPLARATSTCWSRSPSPPTRARLCCRVALSTTPQPTASKPTSRGSPVNSPAAADVAASRDVESVDGVAAPAPAVLEPRTCPTAHRPPGRTGRAWSWTSATSSPPAATRSSSSTASVRASNTSTSATPCRATSTCPSAAARSTSAIGLKALADAGFAGHFSLELETRDVTNDQRPSATAAAAQLISALI